MANDTQDDYNASSIKILSRHVVEAKFPYQRIDALVREYPSFTRAGITKLVTAAVTAGIDLDLVVRRYLDQDKTITLPDWFYECYAAL